MKLNFLALAVPLFLLFIALEYLVSPTGTDRKLFDVYTIPLSQAGICNGVKHELRGRGERRRLARPFTVVRIHP